MSAPPASLTDAPSSRAGGGRGSNLARRAGVLLVTGRRPYASRTQALEPLQSPGTHSRSPGRGTFTQEEETWSSGRDTQTPHYGTPPALATLGPYREGQSLPNPNPFRSVSRRRTTLGPGGLRGDPRRQRGEPQGRGRRGGGLLSHCLSPGISSAFVWGDTSCRGGCIRLLALLCSPKSQLLLPATLALSLSVTLIHLSSSRPPSLSVNHPRGGFTGWPVAGSPALVPAGRSPCPPP